MIFMTSWFAFWNILVHLLCSSSKCTVENSTAHVWENELLKANNMLALSQKLVDFIDSKVFQGAPEAQALRVKLHYPFFLYTVYSHLLPLLVSDLLSIHKIHVTLFPYFRIFANFYSAFSKVFPKTLLWLALFWLGALSYRYYSQLWLIYFPKISK